MASTVLKSDTSQLPPVGRSMSCRRYTTLVTRRAATHRSLAGSVMEAATRCNTPKFSDLQRESLHRELYNDRLRSYTGYYLFLQRYSNGAVVQIQRWVPKAWRT
jgi:hypothetical protein